MLVDYVLKKKHYGTQHKLTRYAEGFARFALDSVPEELRSDTYIHSFLFKYRARPFRVFILVPDFSFIKSSSFKSYILWQAWQSGPPRFIILSHHLHNLFSLLHNPHNEFSAHPPELHFLQRYLYIEQLTEQYVEPIPIILDSLCG